MSYRLAAAALAVASLFTATTVGQQIQLVHGSFDPAAPASLEIAELLRGDASTRLWIVQFDGAPTQDGRDVVAGAGGQIHGYLPDNAYVVRMDIGVAQNVRKLDLVRAVTMYHPAFRLEPFLREALEGAQALPTARYNIVVVDKHNDKPGLIQRIRATGGRVVHEQEGSLLLEAELTAKQLQQAARFEEVLWIDRWTPPEVDVDNARIQGGANHVESQLGYTGVGLNSHIYEGIDVNHPAFSGPVINVNSGGNSTGHGTNTAGIVFGDGTGNTQFRGFAPDAGKFYTNYSSVSTSRYQVVDDLINVHEVSHTTASWGGGRTRAYTATSADTDDIIFDHDIAWTQSQSNAGNQDSRPQAWAKNVFSIGGVNHGDNANANDDSWQAGGASIGPAADGRIKPTLCAYYDNIGTTSQGGGYTNTFGGTSGATPIVAGHNMLAIEMFVNGIFGNQVRNPGGSAHSNRPHFTTLKAMQVASAAQYSFTSGSNDNRREHQGWGFPDLQRMYDYRAKTFIIDETDVIAQGSQTRWDITVAAGEPDLKICMNHADPAANPSANPTRINNLSLRVTSPGGTVYWGNNGLEQGVWSVAGGSEDTINTIECVFVQSPAAGVWQVEVIATLVAQDSHVETPAVDADYALVVSGGTGQGGGTTILGTFDAFGQGCTNQPCPSINPAGGALGGLSTAGEYAYLVPNTIGTVTLGGFEVYSQTTDGSTQNVTVLLYADGGGQPIGLPVNGGSLTVGPNAGFHPATLSRTSDMTGDFWISIDQTAGNIVVSDIASGTASSIYSRPRLIVGGWSALAGTRRPSIRIGCAAVLPTIGNVGLAETNASFDVTLSDGPANQIALAVLGFSDTSFGTTPLPFTLPGSSGCDLLVAPDVWNLVITDGTGAASQTYNVPNDPSLVLTNVFHQWLIADPNGTPVVSDGGRSRIGG